MKRKIKFWLFIFLVLLQIVINRYAGVLKINLDLFFLILVFISVRSGFLATILCATAFGLVTDYFGESVMGVFGFSRTIAAFMVHEIAPYLDLRRNLFLFLLIALSLMLSNLIANTFFYFILNYKFSLNLVLYPGLATGILGVLLLSPPKMKQYLDVY